jgi:hypothetical protein
MIDWCVGQGDPTCQSVPLPPTFDDATVSYTRVVANKFAGNGTAPSSDAFPPADIVYVGADYFDALLGLSLPAGTGNCLSDNKLIKTPTPKDPGVSVIVLSATGELPACQ